MFTQSQNLAPQSQSLFILRVVPIPVGHSAVILGHLLHPHPAPNKNVIRNGIPRRQYSGDWIFGHRLHGQFSCGPKWESHVKKVSGYTLSYEGPDNKLRTGLVSWL